MAETYHIYDYMAFSAMYIAILCAGLGNDSRTKMKLAELKTPPDLLLLASAVDRLSMLVWMQSKDGSKNRNRPSSIVEAMMGDEDKQANKPLKFATPEEFEKARNLILSQIKGG